MSIITGRCNNFAIFFVLGVGVFLSACGTINNTSSQPIDTQGSDAFDPPLTVELPAGDFYMGDLNSIGDDDERPVQMIQLLPFAISKYEITIKQFDQFTDATERARISDSNWGRNNLPAINVSWHDANAYTQWVSQKTGQKWRLPSEAEWEYAARAGSLTNYYSGNQPESVCPVGNIADITAQEAGIGQQNTQCNDEAVHTRQVGSYSPNAFGLYDIHGNVWEWVEDCYQPYSDVVPNISCDTRVIRGGSFLTPARSARVSNRKALDSTKRLPQVGFRVVRDL